IQIYAAMADWSKVEDGLKRLVVLMPGQPEPHYDLAAMMATHGEESNALEQLKLAMDLSAARLKTNPSALNLLQQARSDPHFAALHNLPEYQKIVPPG
ncbi:MAG TPA: hypothetical protein VMH30_01185, partial [Verrucomicrobiae bacterium]|nr:hypothetical protein [Verrucomicrobiae bacterium]